jgi:hypothetical protein
VGLVCVAQVALARSPGQNCLIMSGLGFLQELDVPLLALEGAHWVPRVLAVQVGGLTAGDTPTKLAGRD